MDLPLVSVVIPVFNVEEYLACCIESVLKQTYTNLEIILLDDGSTDRSSEICDEYAEKDARIQVIHKLNTGVSDTRNYGVSAAKGKYVSFLDSDDWIVENLYADIVAEMEADKIDMLKFGFVETDGVAGKKNLFGKQEVIVGKEALFSKFFDSWLWTMPWNGVYTKELAEKVIFPVGIIHEDNYSSGMYLFHAVKVKTLRNEYYYYRKSPGTLSASSHIKRPPDKVLAIKKLVDDLAALGYFDAKLNKKLAGEFYHFILKANNIYRVTGIDKNLAAFIMNNIGKLRQWTLRYYFRKNNVQITERRGS